MSGTDDRQVLEARVLSHPVRIAILRDLGRPSAAVLARSPAEIARDLEVPVGTVAYHMRELRDLGAVELTRTRPVRGSTEHFYRTTGKVRVDGGGDAEALDRIAEELLNPGAGRMALIRDIVRETGRQV